MQKNNVCVVGDFVESRLGKVWVSQIVSTPGRPSKGKRTGVKAEICVCRIMKDTGQILKRSPVFIGTNWINIDA